MNKLNKLNVVLGIAVVTLLNFSIWTQARNSRLNDMINLSDMRSELSQEWTNEVTFSLLNNLNDNHEEGMRNQGRMEGIVEYLTSPKDYQSVWHEGYQRGLNQSEEMARIEKEADKNAPFNKPITPDVIKKPDFDKKIEKVRDTGGE
tara:strand:+ start:170 stop:610 length:441 start_codon:yes stop_codon:yes gene_type:complete